jgi:hypothetical protein
LIINHPDLKITAISFLTRSLVGAQVAKNEQKILIPMMIKNYVHGKKKKIGIAENTAYWSTIVNPTIVPIITPKEQETMTRMNAS